MKSPVIQAADYINDKDKYSELQVMHSNAGYYVGTIYNSEFGQEPGSRDTGYFPTREAAEAELAAIIAGEHTTRMTP